MRELALFVPCYVDQLRPEVGLAALELLEARGFRVAFPPAQTCCGQPLLSAGARGEAARLAASFVRVFARFDAVVAPSGSCAATLRRHLAQLAPSAEARALGERVFELCEFLAAHAGEAPPASAPPAFPQRVALHASCHALRELRLGSPSESREPQRLDPARELLARVPGLELVPLARPDECCGFGGTFAVAEEAVSTMMGCDRIADHERAGVLSDSVNWTKISFLHTSVGGGEQYLVIGNFNDNAGTSVQGPVIVPGNAVAYYYIDDVSVSCIGDVRATSEPCSPPDALNVDILSADPVVIGQDWSASVAIGHPHGAGGGVTLKLRTTCCSGPTLVSPFGGRQTKVLICGPILAQFSGTHNGATSTFGPIPVPVDMNLVGLQWAGQATVLGGGFADLSTAVSGVVGTY